MKHIKVALVCGNVLRCLRHGRTLIAEPSIAPIISGTLGRTEAVRIYSLYLKRVRKKAKNYGLQSWTFHVIKFRKNYRLTQVFYVNKS